MSKKIRLLVIGVFIFSIFGLYGCQTVKGAWNGMKKDFAFVGEADDWTQKNIW